MRYFADLLVEFGVRLLVRCLGETADILFVTSVQVPCLFFRCWGKIWEGNGFTNQHCCHENFQEITVQHVEGIVKEGLLRSAVISSAVPVVIGLSADVMLLDQPLRKPVQMWLQNLVCTDISLPKWPVVCIGAGVHSTIPMVLLT